ncbi:MAG: glycosyltransferase [Actinomycetota bacterium]
MGHIVFATLGLTSLANTNLEMSRVLRAAGHRTTFVAPADRVGPIEAQGENAVALTSSDVFRSRAAADSPPRTPTQIPGWVRRRRQLREESIQDRELQATIAALDPDVVLIDIEFHAAVLATEQLGVPRIAVTNYFSVFRRPGLPPPSTSLAPPTTWLGRRRIELAWLDVWLRGRAGRVRHRLSPSGLAALLRPVSVATTDPADIARLARHHGVNLRGRTDDRQWLRPFLYPELPMVSYNAFEMELPHEPPAILSYVGPMVRLDRAESATDEADRERWESLLAARSAGSERRPLVYATLGTFWGADQSLLRRIIGAFEHRGDWDLVLGLGGTVDPGALAPVPPNVHLLSWAPQLEVLAHADCAITHGGIGTIDEAIWFGVPLVVYSTGFVDQDGCARRVDLHRLGVWGDPANDDSAAIGAAIERALSDPDITSAVASMAEVFRSHAASGAAVNAVEQHLPAQPQGLAHH